MVEGNNCFVSDETYQKILMNYWYKIWVTKNWFW